MWLFLLFLAVPLIEIALFIQIGGIIGMWSTLLVVLATAIAGTWLVRSQGARVLGQVRGSFQNMRDPSEPLAHGAMILFAGALLLTPGFFTDAVGFLLLFPPFRRFAFHQLKARVSVQSFTAGRPDEPPRKAQEEDIIEGDYQVEPTPSPTHSHPHDPSGWTRH